MRQSSHRTSYHLPVIPRLDRGVSLEKGSAQAGNVFVIILLGVFLFGSLMYMFSRNAQQGTGNLTKQQANIAAQEILNYARLVEGAVDRVRRNGCSETEISFANDVVTGYEHTPPARDECKVFDEDGGKITYMQPIENWLDNIHSAQSTYGEFAFTDSTSVTGIETTKQEGSLLLNYIQLNICTEINNQLGIANPAGLPPEDVGVFNSTILYDGRFPNTPSSPINAPETIGRPTGCVQYNGVNRYHFYHVLLAR